MSNVPKTAMVPIVGTFRVRLLKSVTIPANKAITVPVYISEGELSMNTLMLFEGHSDVPEVTTPCTVLNTVNATRRIDICNDRGFIEKLQGDTVVGEATEVQETAEVTNLPEPERTLLLDLLRDYHDIFALEENDPIVFVRKKDSLHRLSVKYRALNAVTKVDSLQKTQTK